MASQNNNALSFLENLVSSQGDKVALNDGLRSLSYEVLWEQLGKVAGLYKEKGLKAGDKIIICSSDTVDAALALLGVVYMGAVVVPISELLSSLDLIKVIQDSNAKAIVLSERCKTIFEEVRHKNSDLESVFILGRPGDDLDFHELVETQEPTPIAVSQLDDPAFLLYSAATQDDSKDPHIVGVSHQHRVAGLSYESFAQGFLNMTSEDRVLSMIRFSTAYGLSTGLLSPLMAGAEVVLMAEQPKTERVLEQLELTKPSVFLATPSIFGQLGRDCRAGGIEPPLKSARACVSGAEDMPAKVIDLARDFLGAEVTVGYGLTECFQFVIAGSSSSGRRGACGTPLAGFEAKILGDDGNVLGKNEIGTLLLRGQAIASEYTDGNKIVQDDGWYKTADRFMTDAEGRFYHCGREDNQFKVSGKWVSPFEIENILVANEAVWECAVIGADDEDGLMSPMAFVVCNIGYNPGPELTASLRAFVKDQLAPYKYPRWVQYLKEMPKGPNGKILRYKLLEKIKGNASRRKPVTMTPPMRKASDS